MKTLNPHNSDDKKRLTPMQVRDEINNRRWKSTVAFQTRNVPHVAHEMLQKAVLML